MNTPNAVLTKFAAESDLFSLDCTGVLAVDDSISGTPVLSFEPDDLSGADALTFSSPVVNEAATTFRDGRIGRAGCVIQFRIGGGTPIDAATHRDYTVIATFTTAQGNTKIARGRLQLLPLAI